MTKNIYSLLLSDAVVSALDARAYELNLSRSALANRILAEYLSCDTPEKRLHDIFSAMEAVLSDVRGFQLMTQPSDSMISLRTALDYKYNPSVRYSVELFKDGNGPAGQLKAQLRSQNAELLYDFAAFFESWQEIEERFCGSVRSFLSGGKYTREISGFRGRELSDEELGGVMSAYIKLLDDSLKLFFARLDSVPAAKNLIAQNYAAFINTHKEVLL